MHHKKITSSAKLELLQIKTASNCQKAIIFLHGLGADYHDFAFLPDWLQHNSKMNWQVILPNAPQQAITINNGYKMRAWYDIFTMDLSKQDDTAGMQQSVNKIIEIITLLQQQGFDAGDIFLGGFSQGGVISLLTAQQYPQKLAGVIALSTYLPFSTILASNSVKNSIFMAHGLHDPVIAYQYAVQSKQKLEENGQIIRWHDYPMEHNICEQELEDLSLWITEYENHH